MNTLLFALSAILSHQAFAFDEIPLFTQNDDPRAVESYTLPTPSDYKPCLNKVDSSKIMLFIDTNSAYREMLRARNVACSMGIKFETIPGEYVTLKTGIPLEKFYLLRNQYNYYKELCSHKSNSCKKDHLADLESKMKSAETIARTVGRKFAYYVPTAMERVFSNAAKTGSKITHLIISGHHYEYGFWGDYLLTTQSYDASYGTEGRTEPLDENLREVLHDGGFGSDFESLVSKYPSVFTELNTLALWGCSSVTNEKIIEYKKYFPSVRIIAGFNGSAPSSIREESQAYLEDYLKVSKTIYSKENESATKSAILGLSNIHNSLSGVYVILDNKNEYLFRVLSGADRLPQARYKFESTQSQLRCQAFTNTFENSYIPEIERYESGQTPIPVDGSGSRLWEIYFELQKNTDCYNRTPHYAEYNSPRVGLLRFYEGLKKNFTQTFAEDLKLSEGELKTLSGTDAVAIQAFLKGETLSSFIFKKERKDIIELSQWITSLSKKTNKAGLNELAFKVNRYLVELHPECTELLAWHEYTPGSAPKLSTK